jgi:5-methylcytosine-specific restriction enzyme subunit McrC
MFLLAYAVDQRGWRNVVAGFEPQPDLFAAIASGFSWHATWAIDRSLLRGYLHRDERRIDVRGRVRFGDQIARAGGLPLPVEVSYDDFTEDILENRMLKTAALLLLRFPRVPSEARRRLQRVRAVLETVEPLVDWRAVKAPPITRINQGYAAALRLAELVLSAASLGEQAGHVRSTTFVFDMNKVFEDFLSSALRVALERHGGRVRFQYNARHLDEAARLTLKPDITWWHHGVCCAVIDAKYKALAVSGIPNADAYQMLAYCIAFGLERGHLVYAKDAGQEPLDHVVSGAGTSIRVRAIDVEREPADVLTEVDALAGAIAR